MSQGLRLIINLVLCLLGPACPTPAPSLPCQVSFSKGCDGPVFTGRGAAVCFSRATFPRLSLAPPSSSGLPLPLMPAGCSDLRGPRLCSSLTPSFLCVRVSCYRRPHPLIISTCVYISKETVISTRPEVVFYRLSHVAACSSLLSALPLQPPLQPGMALGPVSSATSRKPSLSEVAACLSQKLPPAPCLECLTVPGSLTPKVSPFAGLCYSRMTVILGIWHVTTPTSTVPSPAGCVVTVP